MEGSQRLVRMIEEDWVVRFCGCETFVCFISVKKLILFLVIE